MTLWCQVSLEIKQRASLGKYSSRAFYTPSHNHITGAVLRGAIARAYIDRHGGPASATSRAEFRELFDGSTRFGALTSAGLALPAQSVRRCKYHQQDAAHPEIVDLAFADRGPEWCPAGEVSVSPSLYMTAATATAIRPRAARAIDPRAGTAAESQLYSRQAHPHGRTFTGWVIVRDQASRDRLAEITRIVVGARSSVMGSARLTWGQPAARSLPQDLTRVVLRTQSPTFLTDDSGRSSMDFRSAVEKMLDLEIDPAKMWAERELLDSTGGWHAASNLPKPRENGLDIGATVVVENPSRAHLEALLNNGLGLRRSEGYGWLTIAEPLSMPPAEQDTETVAPSPVSINADLDLINSALDPQRRQWLGRKLMDVRSGDQDAVRRILSEPGAGAWPLGSLDAARRLLLNIPDGRRRDIAHKLRGSADA